MEIKQSEWSFLGKYPFKQKLQTGYMHPDHKFLNLAAALIEENFKVQREDRFYIARLDCTYHYANKVLKFYTGSTLHQLIQQRIHREALQLLSHTCLSVKTITYELGLDDPSYFTRSFVRIEGISPSRYRRIKQCSA